MQANRTIWPLLLAGLILPLPSAWAAPAAGDPATQLEDQVEPLKELRPRSSRDEDRVRALALFTAARTAEQKQDFPQALRNYQRAYRLDPDAVVALREIVPLAFNLNRQAEAVRYALLLAEREPSDPVLLRRLGIYLTEEGDNQRALKLYEKAAALHEAAKEKPSASLVLLWMEMGRLYFLTKQYDQAADQFSKVFKALENPKEYNLEPAAQTALLNKGELTYQLFGESFLEAGRPDEALAAFEKSQSIKADEALELYNRARVDMARKQPAQALAKLESFLEKHFSSQGTGPYELYAKALGELGQEDKLLKRLEEYHAADQENLPLGYFLAQRYRQAGMFDKAEPLYRSLLERHKARPPLEVYQGLLEIARQRKDATAALATLGDAVGRAGSLAPLGDAGKALLADREFAKSIVAAAEAQLAAEPDKVSYGQRLAAALVAIQTEDFAAASRLFEQAMKAEGAKPNEALVNWGLELFMASQYAEAVKVFQKGLDDKILPDNNPAIYFYLAGALEMSGRTDEALAAARKAAELQKNSPRFASRVPWIEYHAKRYADARANYEALLKKFEKNHESSEARDVLRDARLVLSNISVHEGKLDEAEEWLEQVLDEFPEDVGALNDLGYLWADAGKHLERALAMIQVAIANEPRNKAYRDSLGWVLFRLGRYPEAVAELKVAAGVDNPDGVILDHLAEAQQKNGETAAALATWRRAIEAFEKESEPDKAAEIREKIAQAERAANEQKQN